MLSEVRGRFRVVITTGIGETSISGLALPALIRLRISERSVVVIVTATTATLRGITVVGSEKGIDFISGCKVPQAVLI